MLHAGNSSRAANTLIIALGCIALCASLIYISSSSATQSLQATSRRTPQMRALGAVEAILNRQEGRVAEMALDGSLLTWTGDLPAADEEPNYGIDYFGDCEVRWKIEPARTVRLPDIGRAHDAAHPWITNPSPDTTIAPAPGTGELPNEYTYLYLVSAEARIPGASGDLAAAQGQRYVSINQEPVFRHVIYYAKKGVKGDLELYHGPPLTVAGSVYSNGAIYLGASANATPANDWQHRNPAPTATTIGSSAAKVQVTGVGGIFAMSKPLMYAAFGGYPMTDSGVSMGAYSTASKYALTVNDSSGQPFPGDPGGVNLGSIPLATANFTEINPYRVLGTDFNTTGLTRAINGISVLPTSGPGSGNDSRDHERSAAYKWNPGSLDPSAWGGKVRTKVTNARQKTLPNSLANRPFEAQALQYREFTASDDPFSDVDEHCEALPLFADAAGNPTTALADAHALVAGSARYFESPGQYLRFAMGAGGLFMVRKEPFTGWEVKQIDGTDPSAPAGLVGLTIRERPKPDSSYVPGAAETTPQDASNGAYQPFAYGKHKKPSVWPFTPLWISDQGGSTNPGDDNHHAKAVVRQSSKNQEAPTRNAFWYDYGGLVTIVSQNEADADRYGSGVGESVRDENGFYRSNWRFMHARYDTDRSSPVTDGVAVAGTAITANLTSGSPLYVPKASFQSIQCEVVSMDGGDTTGRPDGRKAGVMIMGIQPDGSTTATTSLGDGQKALNARNPYAAMLYTPERGFFVQRRGERSAPVRVDSIYFTATDPLTEGTTEPGTKTVTGTAAAPTISQWESDHADSISYTGTQTEWTKDFGEGARVLARGPVTRVLTRKYNARKDRIFRVSLTDAVPDGWFLQVPGGTSDAGKEITGYTGAYGVTEMYRRGIEWLEGHTSGGHYRTAGWVDRSNPSLQSAVVSGAPASAGGPNTLWRGQKDWWTAANDMGGEANLIAFLTDPAMTNPAGGFTILDLPTASPPSPAYPDASSQADPTIPVGFTAPHVFRVPRAQTIDTQSYISAKGTWFAPNTARHYLANPSLATGILPPFTLSYQPDRWTAPTAAGPASSATDSDEGAVVTGANWADKHPPAWTAAQAAGNRQWLRIEKVLDAGRTYLRFRYYNGPQLPPANLSTWAGWQTVMNMGSSAPLDAYDGADSESRLDITDGQWDHLLLGLAQQSGDNTKMTVQYRNITINEATQQGRRDDESISWESATAPNEMTRYLCSQYQVFFGPHEITEDFFDYDNGGARLVTEDWFYNPRQFWSQSRWWDQEDRNPDGTMRMRSQWIDKETGTTAQAALPYSDAGTKWKQFYARTTVLNINVRELQDYISNRTIQQATADLVADGTPAMPALAATSALGESFSGLVYAVRTNRYPWNPLVDGATAQPNPFNTELANTLSNYVDLNDTDLNFASSGRPPLAPPIKPTDFHHGVMLSRADTINWDNGRDQVFGSSGTSFVTPNQLFVWGDLNRVDKAVTDSAADRTVPVAIMGDSITLLSNSWSMVAYREAAFATNSTGTVLAGGGILSQPRGRPVLGAVGGTYQTCIVTNNQPTTRARAKEGEGAPVIDTMVFMENWAGKSMVYKGSLVVLDTCRHTRNFLLNSRKTYGTTPFGLSGWHANSAYTPAWDLPATPDWGSSTGGSMPVYAPPQRTMTFNGDLLSEEGTPPNTPFGLTANGVGGWARVTQ
jgi:hypothetical protein